MSARSNERAILISTTAHHLPHVHSSITNLHDSQRGIRSDDDCHFINILSRNGEATRMDTMRYRTLEIRWHDSKPISTCDFQPIPFKKARPSQEKSFASQSYKLATGGEDNHVRVR